MVVERCNERMTVADYDKYVMTTKAEMDELDRKLVEFTNNDKSFVVTSEYLLRLASQAKQIFESSQPAKKNKILRLLLANCTLNEKRLQLHLLKPFSVLCFDTKSLNWLGRLDDIVYFRLVLGINSCEQALITEPATITIKMVSRLCASLVSKPRKYPPA